MMLVRFGAVRCVVKPSVGQSASDIEQAQQYFDDAVAPLNGAYNQHDFLVLATHRRAVDSKSAGYQLEARLPSQQGCDNPTSLFLPWPPSQPDSGAVFRDAVHRVIQQWILRQD